MGNKINNQSQYRPLGNVTGNKNSCIQIIMQMLVMPMLCNTFLCNNFSSHTKKVARCDSQTLFQFNYCVSMSRQYNQPSNIHILRRLSLIMYNFNFCVVFNRCIRLNNIVSYPSIIHLRKGFAIYIISAVKYQHRGIFSFYVILPQVTIPAI